MSQTSKRNSVHRPQHAAETYEKDNAPTNPFADQKEKRDSTDSDKQAQLSPMFIDYLRKKTGAPDLEKIDTQSNVNDKYRGVKIAQNISPVDGKTTGCNRSHTFDAFVDQRRLSGDAGEERRVGHGWQVARALKRVLSSKGRGVRKARHASALPQGLAA